MKRPIEIEKLEERIAPSAVAPGDDFNEDTTTPSDPENDPVNHDPAIKDPARRMY